MKKLQYDEITNKITFKIIMEYYTIGNNNYLLQCAVLILSGAKLIFRYL
jgi:hypothetical protein